MRLPLGLTIVIVSLTAGSALAYPPPWSHGRGYHDRDGVYIGVYDGYGYPYNYGPPVVVQPPPIVSEPYAPAPYPPIVGESAYPPQNVQPTREYQNDEGQYCREYQTQINIGGHMKKSYGTACKQPDGQWKMIN